MEHEQYLELMSAALDGEITPAERQALDAHLAVCPECAALWQELRDQSAALRALDCEVPEDLKGRIMADLPPQETPRRSPWRRWAAACACLVVVAAALTAPRLFRAGNSAPMGSTATESAAPGDPTESKGFTGDTFNFSINSILDGIPGLNAAQKWSSAVGSAPQAVSACFQTDYGLTPAEGVYVLDSEEALDDFLTQFPAGDEREPDSLNSSLVILTELYDADYFAEDQLAAIVLNTTGGREPVLEDLTDSEAVVSLPQEDRGGDEPAAWLIVTEVDRSFAADGEIELICREEN